MAKVTFNFTKFKTIEAKQIMLEFLDGKKLTPEQWEVLKTEGVIRSNPAKRKSKKQQKK